jgi:Flp pilus assembly pilin Flp
VGGAFYRHPPLKLSQPELARKEVNLLLNLIQALTLRLKREEGQTIVEYGLIIGGVSLVLIGLLMVTGLSDAFSTLVTDVAAQMNPA